MRHRMDGKKLSRTTSHRRALRRNMAAALIQHGAIRTTEAKAKQLRRFVEKLITMAKKDTLHARRQVVAELTDHELFNDEGELEQATLVQKLFGEIAPRYADRPGGYTRIIHL
ncbi:MAG: 50S ribosomal protein L17, partial [Phycisphaerae bacterium]|nr:50S ribosomal protein L17 [Phycisphaerae bacterium]